MRFASTAAQMRALDRAVIEGLGLPGIALMELAAGGVARVIRDHHGDDAARGTAVVCGPGNNGGDGWAVARWLHGWGLPVWVWAVGAPSDGTDAAIERTVARAAGVPERVGVDGAGLVVDAVFGTGLVRAVTDPYAAALTAIAACGAPIVAVDLPSGLETDTGAVLGVCPAATRTVTFGRPKLAMVLGDGPDRCGEVHVVDIGLDAGTPAGDRAAAELPDAADLHPLRPIRRPGDHKGTHGHLLVVAGSAAMCGAAILACRGALAAGVGLVTLAATGPMRARLAGLPPEVM
ncbi:MAG: NAD(P)H-hydrate epimerase, partial [Myxococcota bacterium]